MISCSHTVSLPLNPLWLPITWEMIEQGSSSQAFSYTVPSSRRGKGPH